MKLLVYLLVNHILYLPVHHFLSSFFGFNMNITLPAGRSALRIRGRSHLHIMISHVMRQRKQPPRFVQGSPRLMCGLHAFIAGALRFVIYHLITLIKRCHALPVKSNLKLKLRSRYQGISQNITPVSVLKEVMGIFVKSKSR